MRVVVGVERADVAPVAAVAVGRARHLVGREVVDLGVVLRDQRGDDVAAEVVLGRLVRRVGGDGADQRLGGEDVVAHRGEDLGRRVGQADGVLGLLAEAGDVAPVGGGLDHAELVGLVDRRAQRRDRHALAARDVLLEHLPRVHAVDVVGAEDDDVLRPLVGDQVVVLVDRVGAAHEPARPEAHLRGHGRHVVAEQRRQPPRGRDVLVQRVALVLRQHHDLVEVRVDEVREREVDQAVVAAERHGGLGPVRRERREPLALATRENHRQNLAHAEDLPCVLDDLLQVILALEALRVELVDVLGAGRAGREPAAVGRDLHAADGRVVARRLRQHRRRSRRPRASSR